MVFIKDNLVENKKKKVVSAVLYIVFNIIICFVSARSFVLSRVPTESMYPSIIPGDYVLASKLAYKKHTPKRGDIVLFYEEGIFLCKRIVAIAGDRVFFRDGDIYINDKKIEETYIKDPEVETNSPKHFSVPKDACFVLGDNREKSLDSRYWEDPYVQYSELTAKVVCVLPIHLVHPM